MNISDLSNHAWIEDWANMTERQVTARLTLAMEQYLRGPNLFNPDFVYGGGRRRHGGGEPRSIRLQRAGHRARAPRPLRHDRRLSNAERLRPVDRSLLVAAQDGDAKQAPPCGCGAARTATCATAWARG
jgi:hypothetical protein